MTVKLRTYPIPGSNADKILEFVRANSGTTKNRIIDKLKMNPSVVKGIMLILVEKELATDTPDENGHHHYTAKDVKL